VFWGFLRRRNKEGKNSMAIGLSDALKEGTFVWYNGKAMSYNNFKKGNIFL